MVEDEFEPLLDWVASDAILEGNATNELRAVCDGPNLALFANGELVAETSDSTFSDGDLALAATSFELEPTEIHFDNLIVLQP